MKLAPFLLAGLLIFTTGCESTDKNPAYTSDEDYIYARMESFVSAINNQDATALSTMFSKQAINEDEHLDDEIAALFEFIDSDIISWELDSYSSDDTVEHGKRSLMICPDYIVTTEEEEYELSFIDYPIHDFDPDEKGMYMIEINKVSYDGIWDPWATRKRAGISIVQ